MARKFDTQEDRELYLDIFSEGYKGFDTFDLEFGFCKYQEGTLEYEYYVEGYEHAEKEFKIPRSTFYD